MLFDIIAIVLSIDMYKDTRDKFVGVKNSTVIFSGQMRDKCDNVFTGWVRMRRNKRI